MTLYVPVDERTPTLTITDEAISIPSSAPYQKRLAEVPSDVEGVKIRRINDPVKTATGDGNMTSGGLYTGMVTRTYKVEIDTGGNIEVGGATFKWYRDGAVQGSLIPIEDTDPFPLELGVTVSFSGSAFDLGDYWTFDAEYWTELDVVPTATKEFQVDYATGMLLFFSADSGKSVYATYEGRGSLVKSADIEQIINYLLGADWIPTHMPALAALIVVNNGDVITHEDEIVYVT